jgi:hypothetical protein
MANFLKSFQEKLSDYLKARNISNDGSCRMLRDFAREFVKDIDCRMTVVYNPINNKDHKYHVVVKVNGKEYEGVGNTPRLALYYNKYIYDIIMSSYWWRIV